MPSKFEDAIKDYLSPYEGNFNYQNMFQAHLDPSRFLAWVSQAAEFRDVKGARVLSSGCGSAGDLYAFMGSGAGSAYGIEMGYGLGKLAKSRFEDSEFQKKVCITLYNGNVLPFEINTFDIIFSAHVLEHTQNNSLYLEELFRVLKPGGIIFMDLPNRYYALEQHTLIKYIHYLPTNIRDRFIKFIFSKYKFSDDMHYRLSTLMGYHFPSPAEIISVFNQLKDSYHLRLLTAYFHSYGVKKIIYKHHPLIYFVGRSRRMNTFRLVITKGEPQISYSIDYSI